jgi:hypothetical protein
MDMRVSACCFSAWLIRGSVGSRSRGSISLWAIGSKSRNFRRQRSASIIRREQALVAGNLNDAKEIAIGVFQYNEIAPWRISPWIAAGSELDHAFDFCLAVSCVEIEVQPAPFA